MPAKKKSQAGSASTDSIRRDLQKALADARSKLKGAKGESVATKVKLLNHCKGIIDDIWPC
ncbi:MAG TPA: hypothetical protein VMD98_13150 [Bryocella sp.]|nr:hypothetical protein [Bryocella sp.]